ncbi:MAG: hypothetical protein V4731_05480 [Pseudomonadota bacterium]
MQRISLAASLLLFALLGGCASTVTTGMSREEVLSRLGQHPRIVTTPQGLRFQYSRQPAGQSAVMVDFDASGRVVSAREVMTLSELMRIEPGKWTRADVEREFGPPARVDRVGSWSGDVMNYRWRGIQDDMLFFVYLDQAQVVRRTQQGPDYQPDIRDRN